MRQTHVAGEKLFVDMRDTVPVFDRGSGEERRAHVFVAVLGASNYTYAEARWSEGLADWVGAHVNALAFLGGAPKLLVCDNLRAGVTAACRYEPGINRTYQEMAAHYSTAVLPRAQGAQRVDVAIRSAATGHRCGASQDLRPADQLKRTSEIINDELMSCCI